MKLREPKIVLAPFGKKKLKIAIVLAAKKWKIEMDGDLPISKQIVEAIEWDPTSEDAAAKFKGNIPVEGDSLVKVDEFIGTDQLPAVNK